MSRVEAPLTGIHTRRGFLKVLTMGIVGGGADVATGGRVTKALISAVTTPQVSAASGPKGPERVLTPAATPNPERKITSEALVVSSNPLIFTYPDSNGQSVRRSWEMDNARFGISPNDPDRRVGTVDDTNRDTGQYIQSIQPYTSLYDETSRGPGVDVVITGQLADVSTGSAYLITEVVVNNDHFAAVEYIPNVNKPNDFPKRQVFRLNVSPTFGDAIESSSLGQDNQSKFVKVKKKRSSDPKDDGDWILRLDNNSGKPVGDWSRSPVQNYKRYLPLANS